MTMEVFVTRAYLILKDKDHSLWCPRGSDLPSYQLIPKFGVDVGPEATCCGHSYGFIGKFDRSKLILIKDRSFVGYMPGSGGSRHEVYTINKISLFDLKSDNLTSDNKDTIEPLITDLDLDPCPIHHRHLFNLSSQVTLTRDNSSSQMMTGNIMIHSGIPHQNQQHQKTWDQIKSATSHVQIKSTQIMNRAAAGVTSSVSTSGVSSSSTSSGSGLPHVTLDPKEKLEKRLMDEVIKMFDDTASFYFSPTGDLTSSIQRISEATKRNDCNQKWHQRLDDRFFWNKFMLSDLIRISESVSRDADDSDNYQENVAIHADHWIQKSVIIQGFFQYEKISLDVPLLNDTTTHNDMMDDDNQVMILISRRSRYRAGTRYKRRGVDETGKCANYVETEQIFRYFDHTLSFVQVRGSIPIFWSQPGHAYRPPPKLDRGPEETQRAFDKHFREEISIYSKQILVNLIESSGREKVVGDAYLNHILHLNSPDLTYVTFDFHEYCRGMKFENVSILIQSINDLIQDMKFCWIDKEGILCTQKGTFRINCIDCLDRTNVVQTAIARSVIDFEFTRLGLMAPEGELPAKFRRIFQSIWANNGDTISRQYAGTAALKGDFTRTGERKLTGMFKDSFNSATRYYQNRFKDAYRQAAIDIMLGDVIMADVDLLSPEGEEENDLTLNLIEDTEHHERIKQVIEDCKKILIPETEMILGGWPMIDADPVMKCQNQEMDTVLILTADNYYVAEYDDLTDRISRYQKVSLEDLEKIECGPEPGSLFSHRVNFRVAGFHDKTRAKFCIRLFYNVNGTSGYFHMFKPTETRFFNNMTIPIRTPEEEVESLKAICESFKVALSVKSINVPFFEGKLEKKKSRTVNFASSDPSSSGGKTRNRRLTSDGNLMSLKTAGSKALMGVSSQLSKFKGKLSKTIIPKNLSLDQQHQHHHHDYNQQPLSVVSEPSPSDRNVVMLSSGLTPVENLDDYDEDDSLSLRHQTSSTYPGYHESTSTNSVFATERESDYESEEDDEDDDMSGFEDAIPLNPDEILSIHHEETALEPQSLPPITGSSSPNTSSTYPHPDALSDALLESCGILKTGGQIQKNNPSINSSEVPASSLPVFKDVDDFVLDSVKQASLRNLHKRASEGAPEGYHVPSSSGMRQPEIRISDSMNIDTSDGTKSMEHINKHDMNRNRNRDDYHQHQPESRHQNTISTSGMGMSTASSCVALVPSSEGLMMNMTEDHFGPDKKFSVSPSSTGPTNNSLNISCQMKNSKSEAEMMGLSLVQCVSSAAPVILKKDLVMSPLSRIAKGVQNLGMTLRPAVASTSSGSSPSGSIPSSPSRRSKNHRHQQSSLDPESYEKLKCLKRNCKTRIIEL